jgi:predicted nuclease with TOPRIM domain
MGHKTDLNSQYVKDVEAHNSDLDTKNCKLSIENERLLKKQKQLEGANEDLSKCLEILLEKYGWHDPTIGRIIKETLEKVAKKLVNEKY